MASDDSIVTAETPARTRRFLGLAGGRPRAPEPQPGTHLYVSTPQPDGSRELRRIVAGDARGALSSFDGARFYHVGVDGSYHFAPVFPKALTDPQGHAWDCAVVGRLSITDSRRVLTSFAMEHVGPDSPLMPGLAESWISRQIASPLAEALTRHGAAKARALTATWWNGQLAEWLIPFGLSVEVDEVTWSSAEAEAAEAEAAEAEAARQRELKRIEQARQREREAEIREVESKVEYNRKKRQIEADLALSEQQRAHKLQLLEHQRRKDLIEAETAVENARREAERAALEHEATLARLRHDAEAASNAREREREAEQRHQAVLQEIEGLRSRLQQLADLPEQLLAQLANTDAGRANAAAERLVSPEFGMPASSLAALGFRVERQSMVQGLRERAASDGQQVAIRKTELVTRDIGTARVQGLPINTSLRFEFISQRSGYITLLNLGTSGAVYVHVPNAYVGPEVAKVEGGRCYMVPGSELLPWERLRQLGLDYVEVGPPGWEHLAVLVSDEPLIGAPTLAKAGSAVPFVKLEIDEIADLCETLGNMPARAWTAGVLSFLVG